MAHVEPGPGGIGEHIKAVELGLLAIVRNAERPMILPVLLPFRLNGAVIVSFAH
jgi:hypothetical protein